MPKILRVELTSDQEREVRERLWARDLVPGTRLRLECIRLMGRGLTVPEVADLLECNEVTVRGAVHRFTAGGFDALADAPRLGRPASVTREDREALAALLDESARQGRTCLPPRCVTGWPRNGGCGSRRPGSPSCFHRDGFRWKRTRDTLRHKADPVLQQAARAQLEDLHGVEIFYLPPRSPELNDIERVWRSAKYEDYPERVHTTAEAVGTAVDQALERQRARIKGSAANFTKAA
ncbi:helix-turn-helix domain-containing protein [Streptomyces sp. NPDC048269]|uniref:helix-turn-helix domain-containing protein n=1 Tax=Streptomyces sp. NPDC048269 TaxID=3155753 RepID=UPI0034211AA0